MSKKKLVHIGTLGKPVGLKGEIKILTYTSSMESFFLYKPKLSADSLTKWNLSLVRKYKGQVIVKNQNLNSLESVKNLLGKKIYVNRKSFPKTKKNEYYYTDLIDFKIMSSDKKYLGTVKSIKNYGAGDLINVHLHDHKDYYLPINNDVIISINLQKMIIIVNPIKGLID